MAEDWFSKTSMHAQLLINDPNTDFRTLQTVIDWILLSTHYFSILLDMNGSKPASDSIIDSIYRLLSSQTLNSSEIERLAFFSNTRDLHILEGEQKDASLFFIRYLELTQPADCRYAPLEILTANLR
jgi:hypothetical protein